MSFHIVTIDSADCFLGCRNGQLTCKSGTTTRSLPLEDVASIVVTGFSTSIHSHLLVEAAKHGVALIFCEAFKPISLLLPANRCTDTLLTRAQVALSTKKRSHLWCATIDSKCSNQLAAASMMTSHTENLDALRQEASNPSPHKEASCAKQYWKIFSKSVGCADFNRERNLPGLNSMLNYGYAVLLSAILQKLFALGIDPTFGISHAIRERSTPLAYDLMEPFRPLVDLRIFEWIRQSQPQPSNSTIDKEFRKWITGFLLENTAYLNTEVQVQTCIEAVVRRFRRAIMSGHTGLYKPWILKNSKWAG